MGRKSRERKERKERKARKARKAEKAAAPKTAKAPVLAEGGIPMPGRKSRDPYYLTMMPIQLELLKLHRHLAETGERVVVIFEGRYAAGKTAMIETFTEFMLPKHVYETIWRPAEDNETTQWYFQRFISELPHAGQVQLCHRGYYTRAWVESTNGTCTPEQAQQADTFIRCMEEAITGDGIKVFKYWLSVSEEEQKKRMDAWKGSLVAWKLDHLDLDDPANRDALTAAKEAMFAKTSTDNAPWMVVDANDEKLARIACLSHFINSFDYPEKNADILKVDEGVVRRA